MWSGFYFNCNITKCYHYFIRWNRWMSKLHTRLCKPVNWDQLWLLGIRWVNLTLCHWASFSLNQIKLSRLWKITQRNGQRGYYSSRGFRKKHKSERTKTGMAGGRTDVIVTDVSGSAMYLWSWHFWQFSIKLAWKCLKKF